MANFKWVNRETGETDNLKDVDNAIRAHVGQEPDQEQFSGWYNYLVEFAMQSMWHFDDWDVVTTGDGLEKIFRRIASHGTAELTQFQKDTIRWAFLDKWEFRAWHGK